MAHRVLRLISAGQRAAGSDRHRRSRAIRPRCKTRLRPRSGVS